MAAETPSMLVDFQLYVEGRKPTLLMSGTIAAGEGEITPINISREQAFVASVSEVENTRFLIPATYEEGMTVLVARKTQSNPVLVLKVTSGTDVQPAIKPGDTGVAVSDGFVTGWPVVAGAQEHRFKVNGKRYRAVIETK